jgi:hypothetical protein
MRLYRYQPINKYTLINLSKRSNWSADPLQFNDPFEFALKSEWYLNDENIMTLLTPEKIKSREVIRKFLLNCGVISYSSNIGDKLLWSHYGDFHRGMCLSFDFSDKQLSEIVKVKYQKQIHDFQFSENIRQMDSSTMETILTKSTEWEYENEWRVVLPTKNEHYKYLGNLTGISFGCKCAIEDIEMVLSIMIPIYGPNISYSKFFIQHDTFNLSESFLSKEIVNKESISQLIKSWMKLDEKRKFL